MSHRPLMPRVGSNKWARIYMRKAMTERGSRVKFTWDGARRRMTFVGGGNNAHRFGDQCRPRI